VGRRRSEAGMSLIVTSARCWSAWESPSMSSEAVMRFAKALLLGLLGARTVLEAQVPRRVVPAPASETYGVLRGIVYDSLLHGTLEGAHVWIEGTPISATTDAGGRFRMDSVPSGSHIIGFEHPDLDSAGLSN